MAAALAGPAAADEPATIVRGALDLVCAARGRDDLERLGDRLLGGRPLHRPTVTNLNFGRRWIYPADDGRLILDWLWPRGDLPHFMVQYASLQGSRPEVLAILDHRCALRAARRLLYDSDGLAEWLEDLDDTLQPNGHREPLNPPVPPHADPGGLPVAIIDTGVNYLLPEINRRLARDPTGALLGYDFWDLDERPFDVNPRRSAFYPDRHGTAIAGIVLAEAPVARLLPYRYPRPDMSRLAMLIDHAASNGARIVNLALTSSDRAEWAAFEQAATRHPEILFVVAAGNDNRDIDRYPEYPGRAAAGQSDHGDGGARRRSPCPRRQLGPAHGRSHGRGGRLPGARLRRAPVAGVWVELCHGARDRARGVPARSASQLVRRDAARADLRLGARAGAPPATSPRA